MSAATVTRASCPCSSRAHGRDTRVTWGVLVILFLGTLPATSLAADVPANFSVLRTKYYRIHTDLDRELAEDLARRMDAMYDEYQRRLSAFTREKAGPPLEVYLFRRQQDYLRFTGERWRNSGGVFMASRNLLAAFLEGQGRDALRRTLQHEAFHQFAALAISPEMPVWLNEGMAQLFEEGIWTGDGFWLGQVPPRRVRQLEEDIKKQRLVRFDKLMAITPEQWSSTLADDHGAGATQYNQSWAMVHFLVQARDAAGKEKYRGRLVQMLQQLHNGRSGREAFEAAFSTNVKGFQDRFVEYARALEPTPEASMIERQEVLADFVIELKNKGRTFHRMSDLRETAVRANFTLRYSDRGMSWQTDPNVATYFSDIKGRPLGPNELYFADRRGAALPDIICRASDRLQLRTRFHPVVGKKFEHEVLIESPRQQAQAD
jgi:hypothetical protein